VVIQLKNVFIVKRNKYIHLALLKSLAVSALEKGEKKQHWSGSVRLSSCLLIFHYGGGTDIFWRDWELNVMVQILRTRAVHNRTQTLVHQSIHIGHKLSIDEFQHSLTNTIY